MSAEIEMLAEVPLFALLDQKERKTLAKLLNTKHFGKGDTVFSYGDAGDALYLVRTGRVEVFVENTEGEKILLAQNEAGDLFGEISLLDGGARTATAVSVEETEALTLDREHLLKFITQHPHAALDLLTVDALVTYAFEAASTMPGTLDERGTSAMRRFARAAQS